MDTETTVDEAQGLLFGAFRYARVDANTVTTVAEGLIYADDLPDTDPEGFGLLQGYVLSHKAGADLLYLGAEPTWQLQLVSRREFTRRWLWHVGYPHNRRLDPATIVCFNLPFDLSRIAVDVADARADMKGGFSFTVWDDDTGRPAAFRPRVAVKNLDSKRALKKFRKLERGKNDFTGHLLDLRTLVFALTGESHSLDSACARLTVEGKAPTPELGVISTEGVDYCRQDVQATTNLLQAVLVEYSRHPIELQATQAYSPASVAKSYLDAMGIQPRLDAQPDFSPQLSGYCMSAFYGGRAEVKLRRVPVPVRLLDFTSMYPTVNLLMGIWDHVIAERIDTVDATTETQELLNRVSLEDCFDPALWRAFPVVAEIIPDGDVLPVRANYRPEDWSIGVNPLHADQPFWYTLPDLIASKLHTGHTPQIRTAYRFVPVRRQATLRPVELRGELRINPRTENFFQAVVEQRQRLKMATRGHQADCSCEECETAAFLKVLANAGSYGIYAEMIRQEQPGKVTVHASSGEPFTTKVNAPEKPGRYCFPPIAACITGAARLMLTLLERSITDAGGTWVFCDTDSMAIVATPTGQELLACPGGTQALPESTEAVLPLNYDTVEDIRRRFNQLNPYDKQLVPDILKVDATGTCLAISAKRYVLYNRTPLGDIDIVKRSEHGLGRYLPPRTMPLEDIDENARSAWVDECWRWIIQANDNPNHPLPEWAEEPTLTRITISSPLLARPFTRWNKHKPWADRIKPCNFLLVADLDPFGLPPGAEPHRFRLIAAYDTTRDGRDIEWRNLYDPEGPTYRVTTDRLAEPNSDLALVKSYGQILREYHLHPEYKFSGPDREPCSRATRGLLQRRSVDVVATQYIGKEANKLDEVRAGIVGASTDVVTTYSRGHGDVLQRLVLPVLTEYSGRELAELVGVDRRTIDRVRAGAVPRDDLCEALGDLACRLASRAMTLDGCTPEAGPAGRASEQRTILAAYLGQRPPLDTP